MDPVMQAAEGRAPAAMPSTVSLETFLGELRRISAGVITRQELCSLLQRLTIDPADLRPYEHWLPDRHTRNLIYRNERIEAMLLCWPAGAQTPPHTHNGQLGWMAMISGCLEVENFRYVDCNLPENQQVVGLDCLAGATEITLERISKETCVPGGPLNTVDKKQTIHRITNPGDRAVSLHLYSLPIDSCVVFDLDAQTCRRRDLAFDNE
ncbi:MAG TPA: cysteine dioxygenase family protein [Thermoanaerobaculia bacterium]